MIAFAKMWWPTMLVAFLVSGGAVLGGLPELSGAVVGLLAAAAMAAYAVLRSCGLIGAGDWRVPERIGRTLQDMINGRAARAGAA